MEKLVNLIYALLVLVSFATTSIATTYVVGDTSGWDISTNLDTWASDKTFKVGDVLRKSFNAISLRSMFMLAAFHLTKASGLPLRT